MTPGQTLLIVLFDEATRAVRVAKGPTTVRNQADGTAAQPIGC